MNKYKAKSQKYQIFVTSNSTLVKFDSIIIPKLSITLFFRVNIGYYTLSMYGVSVDTISKDIKNRKNNFTKQKWFEFNHFIIENELINLIKSEDVLNLQLATEILLLKLDKLNIPKQ